MSGETLPTHFCLGRRHGAQGGGAEGVAKGFDVNGLGAIRKLISWRCIAYKKEGCDEHDFAKAARREVIRMKEDIISYLPKISD